MDLGAPPWKTFLLITVPMIAPSIVAGWLLSFTLSLDDLVLASFVSGPGSTTLPMEIFSAVRLGMKPEINAIASVILFPVSMFTLLVWFIFRRADKHSQLPPPEETSRQRTPARSRGTPRGAVFHCAFPPPLGKPHTCLYAPKSMKGHSMIL